MGISMDFLAGKIKLSSYISLMLVIWTNECFQNVYGEPDLMAQMKAVKDRIFRNYDKNIRPMNATNTTDVHTDFLPRQILHLDEEAAILVMDSYLFMSWLDPRLQWNSTDYDGYLVLPKEFLWVPDISIHNSHSMQVDPTQDVLLGIYPSGDVVWVPPIMTQTTCPTASKVPYPNDEVTCLIQFGSWMHDGWSINYNHANDLYMDEFVDTNPRWKLNGVEAIRNVTYYDCCPEPYISIQIKIHLKRRPVPEIETTRASCIMVMILTLAIFWLPPDSSQKLLLGGILFLVLNILLVYVAWSTHYPLSVLFAVSFLQTTMYLVATTILVQVFVVIKIGALSGPSRPPPIIMQFLTGPLGKYTCLRSPMSDDRVSLDRLQLKEDASTVENFSARDEWKLFAAAIDRALFVVMSIVMVAVHHL